MVHCSHTSCSDDLTFIAHNSLKTCRTVYYIVRANISSASNDLPFLSPWNEQSLIQLQCVSESYLRLWVLYHSNLAPQGSNSCKFWLCEDWKMHQCTPILMSSQKALLCWPEHPNKHMYYLLVWMILHRLEVLKLYGMLMNKTKIHPWSICALRLSICVSLVCFDITPYLTMSPMHFIKMGFNNLTQQQR